METDAAIIETDATDIEGLATPIAPQVVIEMAPANGATNGKAPKTIGELCDASAARASASRGKAVCTPSATTAPVRPARTKAGSRVTGWGGLSVRAR